MKYLKNNCLPCSEAYRGYSESAPWALRVGRTIPFTPTVILSGVERSGTKRRISCEFVIHSRRFLAALGMIIIICLLPASSFAQNPSVIRGPYLQVGTPSSMIVRWRTDSLTPVNGRVWYGTQLDTATMAFVDSASLTTEHEIKITGLTSNTKYFYAIGTSDTILAGPDSMQYFQTSPMPGTNQLIRVWAIGDFGEGNSNQAAVRDAYKNYINNQHTDVWIWLGDNAYDAGEDSEYQTNCFEMYPDLFKKTVVWPSPGNHDYGSSHPFSSDPSIYFNNFTMPINAEAGGAPSGDEGYYSFDYGNVHFISLSSEDYTWSGIFPDFVVTHSPAMISWLENDLAANTNKDWIIAYWHATPYSEGTHSENYNGPDIIKKIDGLAMRSMRDNLVPILENYGVDLILCGHSHNYERSYLVHGFYGPDSPYLADSIKVDTLSGSISPYIKYSTGPNPNLGTVYTVVGSSAKTGNFGSDGQLDHPLMYTGDYILGSMMIEINGNQLDAYFIDTSGAAFDNFTILKDPTGIDQSALSDLQSLIVHPNPFSNNVQIEYTLNASGSVSLEMYNLLGQHVYTIVDEKQESGKYSYLIDATNTGLAKGVYFLQLKSGERLNTKKIVKL